MFKSRAKKTELNLTGPQSNASLSFIGPGCTVTGELVCQGNLRIDGEVIGNISVSGNLEISSGGRVHGAMLSATNIDVHGHITSHIQATGLLRLHKQAVVEGDLSVSALDIENGARFVGYSHTGSAEVEVRKLDHSPVKEK